jgi:hypothetical protein
MPPGALTWEYAWWNARAPWLIIVLGYLHFFVVAFWVHDMASIRSKALTVGIIHAIDLVALLTFTGNRKLETGNRKRNRRADDEW